jgi:hypothetical protein
MYIALSVVAIKLGAFLGVLKKCARTYSTYIKLVYTYKYRKCTKYVASGVLWRLEHICRFYGQSQTASVITSERTEK